MGSLERIQGIANRVLETYQSGNQIAIVVSAMSGETNRLADLARQINPVPYSRDYDILLASGEQVTVGLLSLALNTKARELGLIQKDQTISTPLLGYQLGIRTNRAYSRARIEEIDTAVLQRTLSENKIAVIAGFQGVDADNYITTLGRGGSDTSAVAIACALEADEVEIYTDVDGVYTTDPRICPSARKISEISYEEMMELAGLGAKVLQIRSVELAAKYEIPIHVRSSFKPEKGTLVMAPDKFTHSMEDVLVSGVASDENQVLFLLDGIPNKPALTAKIFTQLSDRGVVVDIITLRQDNADQLRLSFSVGSDDAKLAQSILKSLQDESIPTLNTHFKDNLAKISIVGVGMQNHPGVASKMFSTLADEGIEMVLVSTSEIKVSCLIDRNLTKTAVNALHASFELDKVR